MLMPFVPITAAPMIPMKAGFIHADAAYWRIDCELCKRSRRDDCGYRRSPRKGEDDCPHCVFSYFRRANATTHSEADRSGTGESMARMKALRSLNFWWPNE